MSRAAVMEEEEVEEEEEGVVEVVTPCLSLSSMPTTVRELSCSSLRLYTVVVFLDFQ